MPFIASGLLKTVYLAGFYALFRNVRPPEEEGSGGKPPAAPG